MDAEIHAQILEIVQKHGTLTLATLREDGWPQATRGAYVNSHLTLYIAIGADAQKLRNVRQCEKVSLTIDSGYADWSVLQGLSMAAVAHVIESASERQQAARMLNRKFPDLAEFSDPEHDRGWAFLRIEPKVISLIDYRKGFGHTVLVRL
ncbi:MAG TPA: pyridoxamine 5'-phosphate oxidase family protein, partial [Burkholderiales bacterium]|nr:pyridoxamine 5'-phosphate oxidase family protein [Burkholderiales bacterium]